MSSSESSSSFSSQIGKPSSPPYVHSPYVEKPGATGYIQATKAESSVGASKSTGLTGGKVVRFSAVNEASSGEENVTISRDELNAKLAQNKAEVESVASAMRTEMANFRTAYVESFKEISITLNKLDAKSDATEKRLTQAQWIVSLVISISAVTLSAVIYFSNKANVKPPQQQPSVVINTSQQPGSTTQSQPHSQK